MNDSLFNIDGKTAVVTGGGGVLGSNISKALLQSGVKVIIIDIRQDALDNKMKELKKYGEISAMACDVMDMHCTTFPAERYGLLKR